METELSGLRSTRQSQQKKVSVRCLLQKEEAALSLKKHPVKSCSRYLPQVIQQVIIYHAIRVLPVDDSVTPLYKNSNNHKPHVLKAVKTS